MDVFLDNANVETRNRKFIAKEWGNHGIEPLIMWIEQRKMRSDSPPFWCLWPTPPNGVCLVGSESHWWVEEILQQQKDG